MCVVVFELDLVTATAEAKRPTMQHMVNKDRHDGVHRPLRFTNQLCSIVLRQMLGIVRSY